MNKIFWFRAMGILMFLAMIAVFSVIAMLLWNALMPEIFGLSALSYWQAAGLLVLARILFGGLGLGHWGARGGHGFHHYHGNALREKWLNMSDEERKEFLRSNWKHRKFSHFHGFFDEQPGESKGGENEHS